MHNLEAPEALLRMLARYELNSVQDYKNAVKEIVQEIVLLGLWRAKFFEKGAFYGGTALRILYRLDRFSEDLDFSLLSPDSQFDLKKYEAAVRIELESLGFVANMEKKVNLQESAIDSAFVKLNTIKNLLVIRLPEGITKRMHRDEVIKIRFEVDTNPPQDGAVTENRLLLLPIPFSVKSYRIEDLFAGKLHAALCREWKGRVKGRDWYDLVWFASRGVRYSLHYLEARMRQSGYWVDERKLTEEDVHFLFQRKIEGLDVESAKSDVVNFIKDPLRLKVWSKDFFRQIVAEIKVG